MIHDPGTPPLQREAAKDAFRKAVQNILNGQGSFIISCLKHFYVPFGWGLGTVPDYNATQLLIRSHILDGHDRLLRAMLAGSTYILGANQVGLSLTTGLGTRNVATPFTKITRAMGFPAPPGSPFMAVVSIEFNFGYAVRC